MNDIVELIDKYLGTPPLDERTYKKFQSTLTGRGFKRISGDEWAGEGGHKIVIKDNSWSHVDPFGKVIKTSDNTPDLQDHIKKMRNLR